MPTTPTGTLHSHTLQSIRAPPPNLWIAKPKPTSNHTTAYYGVHTPYILASRIHTSSLFLGVTPIRTYICTRISLLYLRRWAISPRARTAMSSIRLGVTRKIRLHPDPNLSTLDFPRKPRILYLHLSHPPHPTPIPTLRRDGAVKLVPALFPPLCGCLPRLLPSPHPSLLRFSPFFVCWFRRFNGYSNPM